MKCTNTTIRCWLRCLLACLALILPATATAQTANTGALTGAVTDNSGAVVPDVKITVTNEATGEARTVASQQNGNFVVPLLLPGSYRVELSKAGF